MSLAQQTFPCLYAFLHCPLKPSLPTRFLVTQSRLACTPEEEQPGPEPGIPAPSGHSGSPGTQLQLGGHRVGAQDNTACAPKLSSPETSGGA